MTNNNKLTCMVVDDEQLALDVLKRYIESLDNLELVGTYTDSLGALTMLQQHTVELLFLDIEMPQLSGMDLLRSLNNPPKVIFTTGFSKYAVEAFELNAADFLLKPISFERFLKAVNKVMGSKLQLTEKTIHIEKKVPEPQDNLFITLRSEKRNLVVPLNEILYIESLRDYIKVVTIHKTIITKYSISSLEETLPRNQFIRIHRSFIISINKIQSFTHETIEIAKKEFPISRMYKLDVEKTLHFL